MALIQLQPSTTMPETHSLCLCCCPRDTSRRNNVFVNYGIAVVNVIVNVCANNSTDVDHHQRVVTKEPVLKACEETDPSVVQTVIPVPVPNREGVGKAKATEERSKVLIGISLAILTILTGSGILVMSSGSRLLTASSFRSHKALYSSVYTVYALNFILTIISILLSYLKPYCHRPRVHTAACYLVGGSLILLLVVLSLGACAQFISSDQTSSPPPPPPGLLHHQLKRIPGS